jgi:hypothetical protein
MVFAAARGLLFFLSAAQTPLKSALIGPPRMNLTGE